MNIFSVISLFGGLALFLYGMRVMGDGLKSNATGVLKPAIDRFTGTKIGSFLTGLGFTALIQSSTATIVLTSGLVGAEIITLRRSIGIILGANVGTTVTGQIIRLLDVDADPNSLLNFFKPATLAPLAAIAGMILIMFVKGKKSDTFSGILMGFAVLFTGLLNMTASVSALSESPSFSAAFLKLADSPFLSFLLGLGVCFLLQSQSATVGIVQALSMAGGMYFKSVYAVLLGVYIGDSMTTAIVCSIGAKADPKRVGVIHVLFNIAQVILLLVVVTALHLSGMLGGLWEHSMNPGLIANTNTLFKLFGAIAMLPLARSFEDLSRKIVKDDEEEKDEYAEEFAKLNDNLFRSPGMALASTFSALCTMTRVTEENLGDAMDLINEYSAEKAARIAAKEEFVDRMADRATDYLARLSPLVNISRRNEILNYYYKCIDEFERIADHALNIAENVDKLREKGVGFSNTAVKEMALLRQAQDEIIGYTFRAFRDGDYRAAKSVEPVEEIIDTMVEHLREYHLTRLKNGQCNVYSGFVFLDMLVNIERIADQCSNIGIHTISLFDADVADMQHEYIRKLEQDQQFQKDVKELEVKYMDALVKIENEPNAAYGGK
ncbi:MAG: Na/Pi cotransporter family protein [Firmicutes bacterium]|nr:Na/Pi cotransporter family protein [Bacillota bacterium]